MNEQQGRIIERTRFGSDVLTIVPGVLNAALEIADKRRETLARLRAALEQGDDTEALKVARTLCRVENGEKSHRADPRVN
jgi:hypothetical protein